MTDTWELLQTILSGRNTTIFVLGFSLLTFLGRKFKIEIHRILQVSMHNHNYQPLSMIFWPLCNTRIKKHTKKRVRWQNFAMVVIKLQERDVNSSNVESKYYKKVYKNVFTLWYHLCSFLRGHSETTLTSFRNFLTTYLPPVYTFAK